MIKYFIIAVLATLIGATAGMGGGVIIKPLMELQNEYSIIKISILSSVTVLSMAITATVKQKIDGFNIDINLILISIFAALGGIFGSYLFKILIDNVSLNKIQIVQSVTLIIMLSICVFYEVLPRSNINNILVTGIVGIGLGLISSFLGIGGGPINVAVLYLLFRYELSKAARASVLIILFSQTTNIISKGITGMLSTVEDYTILFAMIPAAIIGGLIGAKLNRLLKENYIKIIYKISVIAIILISIYNIFRIETGEI